MGFLDDAKKKLTDAVDEHGDKVSEGIDKAAQALDDRTGGKHSDKIAGVAEKAEDALEKLDGSDDGDMGRPLGLGRVRRPRRVGHVSTDDRNVDDRDSLDKPAPPGGPNRADAPEGDESPGEPARDPGPQVERVTKPEGHYPEPAHDAERPEQSTSEERRQEENAEESDFGEPSQ